MHSRILLLVGAMLASPTWSQELVVDLHNDSIKKIVRDTAATQFATVQLSNEKTDARKPIEKIDFVRPVAKPPVKYPIRLPDPAPRSTGIFATLIDTLLNSIDDYPGPFRYDNWISCQARDDLKTARQLDGCPSASPKDLQPAGGP